jgi:hypothetical protein
MLDWIVWIPRSPVLYDVQERTDGTTLFGKELEEI